MNILQREERRLKQREEKNTAHLRFLIRSKWFKLQERGYKQGDFRAR